MPRYRVEWKNGCMGGKWCVLRKRWIGWKVVYQADVFVYQNTAYPLAAEAMHRYEEQDELKNSDV